MRKGVAMQRRKIAIYGVGGFGREVLALIKNINEVSPTWDIIGFFDDGYKKGVMVNGYPILGNIDDLNKWESEIGIAVSIGSPKIKEQIVKRILNSKVQYPTLIHPKVEIEDNEFVRIGKGCIICAYTVITTNIVIEDFVILNLACTVGHDSKIGRYSAFMPMCNISGEVAIEEGVYCGTGVKIINQVNVGRNTIIGAGAVVTKSLPSDCTAVGMPAKVIKVSSE